MSRVQKTADALAALSLEASPGNHLGGEEELLDRLQVSRPTLRQAAKLVESDRLLEIRRGVRGGFYASRPDAADAIRAPARYLRLNGATIVDLHVATVPVAVEVASLAAECTDPEPREELLSLRDRVETADGALPMIRCEIDLMRLLARMSGNPAARLFIEIGYTFGQEERNLRLYRTVEDRRCARTVQLRLIDAVLDGDGEMASLMVRRKAALLSSWMTADVAQ